MNARILDNQVLFEAHLRVTSGEGGSISFAHHLHPREAVCGSGRGYGDISLGYGGGCRNGAHHNNQDLASADSSRGPETAALFSSWFPGRLPGPATHVEVHEVKNMTLLIAHYYTLHNIITLIIITYYYNLYFFIYQFRYSKIPDAMMNLYCQGPLHPMAGPAFKLSWPSQWLGITWICCSKPISSGIYAV